MKGIRSRIDEVDLRILRLLEERARWVAAIASVKKSNRRPLYSESREEEIFRRLLAAGDGSFPSEGVQNVFHEVISACLNLQKRQVGTGKRLEDHGWLSGVSEAIRSLPNYIPGQRRPLRFAQGTMSGRMIGSQHRGKRTGNVVRLSGNENNYGTSPAVRRAVAGALGSLHLYPDKWATEPAMAVARALRVAPGEVVLGNGSDELIDLVFRTFLRAGKEALLPHPSFTYYEIAARACGARAVAFPLIDYQYDVSRIRTKVSERTALVVLANPNNPTGTYVNRRDLTGLLKTLPKHVMVVLDEAYWGYPEAEDYPDGVRMRNRHPNLIVLRTFSKIHGLAGLRCAFAVCDKSLASVLNKLRQPFNVNLLAQAAVVAAMSDGQWPRAMAKKNLAEKQLFRKELERLGFTVVPSQANFLLVLPPGRRGLQPASRNSGSLMVKTLAARNIWVRDTTSFGIPGAIRVTVGKRSENVRLLKAMGEILNPP